jgi:ABC-type transporter Mla MlaB component
MPRKCCDEGKGVPSGVPPADVRYDDGVLTITDMASPPGLALAGDIDETHYAPLVHVLDDFSTSREVHLDLSGLTYCDVACLRAMVCLARPDGADHTAPDVVLHAVPPYLHAILNILGWDRLPGLSMHSASIP